MRGRLRSGCEEERRRTSETPVIEGAQLYLGHLQRYPMRYQRLIAAEDGIDRSLTPSLSELSALATLGSFSAMAAIQRSDKRENGALSTEKM